MASQQAPSRPWFRLPSLSRQTQAPAPAPAPPRAQALPVAQPRPPIVPPTQPAQLPLAPPTQAPTPLPVAAAPPPRATAPPPAPAQKSPPPRAAATPLSPVPSAPPRAPISTPSPNAISPEPRVKPEELKSTMPLPPSPKPAPPPLAPASQSMTSVAPVTIAATSEPTVKPLARPDPSPSPKMKPLTSPPSPLTLPPPQLKSRVEHRQETPKTVLVQETVEKHMVVPSNGQNHSTDITRRDGKPDVRKDNGNYKNQSDSEEFGRRIITLAGQNKGAVMEWIPSNKKNGPPSLHKNSDSPRTGRDGEKYGSESDGNNEGKGKSKLDKSYKARTNSSQPMSAFVNSNVQSVNNSILYNCSYSHHDPGVHFSVSRKANGHGNGVKPNNKDHINRQNI